MDTAARFSRFAKGESRVLYNLGASYVFGGVKINSPVAWTYYGDTYTYNPTLQAWTAKAIFPNGVNFIWTNEGFLAGSKGFSLSTRGDGTSFLLEYNPQSDAWINKGSPPQTISGSSAFSLSSSMGYFLTGNSSSKAVYKYLSDELAMSGPHLVCSNSNTFTLNHVATGGSIIWTKSSNVTYVSGQSTKNYKVAGNSNGPGWVRADISFTSGVSYFQQANFWVGAYGSSNYPINGPTNTCSNQFVYYTAPVLQGATNYNWSWPSSWTYSSGQGTNQLALIAGSESGAVTLGIDNICGPAGSPSYQNTQVYNCGYSIRASPNPATDVITIQFVDSGGKQLSISGESQLEIEIVNQKLEKLVNCNLHGKNLEVPVSSLPEGPYFLRAILNGEVFTERIVIRR